MPLIKPNCELCGGGTLDRCYDNDCEIMVCPECRDHLASAESLLARMDLGPCKKVSRRG
jgi:hypothetical protein